MSCFLPGQHSIVCINEPELSKTKKNTGSAFCRVRLTHFYSCDFLSNSQSVFSFPAAEPSSSSTSSSFFFFSTPSPSLKVEPVVLSAAYSLNSRTGSRTSLELTDMRLGLTALLCFFSVVLQCDCTPPTCYSRSLSLSKEIMTLLDKIHNSYRTVRTLHCSSGHVRPEAFTLSNSCCVDWFVESVC